MCDVCAFSRIFYLAQSNTETHWIWIACVFELVVILVDSTMMMILEHFNYLSPGRIVAWVMVNFPRYNQLSTNHVVHVNGVEIQSKNHVAFEPFESQAV